MKIGLDVGSTTLKCVVLDEKEKIVYQEYERHFSRITEKASEMLCRIAGRFPQEPHMRLPFPVQQVWVWRKVWAFRLFRKSTRLV